MDTKATSAAGKREINFTKRRLDTLPLPAEGKRVTYHAKGPELAGLQLRITAGGTKTFYVFRRAAHGAPERVCLGRYPALSIERAGVKAKKAIADLAEGKSQKRVKKDTLTFKEALEDYVGKKRRSKDNLPLKERTKADYLAMVAPGKEKKNKTRNLDGELFQLADKPIHGITGDHIRDVYDKALDRGERRAAYAMQVLRAVLNWHGVDVADNPLSKEVAGKKVAGRTRIHIPKARDAKRPIKSERIGAWWNAASALDTVAADYLRFCLLTGCRPGEPLKVLVGDCDLIGGRVLLRDTKNRRNHELVLSTQSWQIMKRHAEGKAPGDRLFAITDPKKTVRALAKATGIEFSTKDLRSTFATIASKRTTVYVLDALINHIQQNDMTGTHYVEVAEAELRAGWQAVADHIEALAGKNVVPMPERQVAA